MYFFLVKLLDPFLLLMLGVGAAIFWVGRSQKESSRAVRLAVLAYLALYLCCMPMAAYFAVGSLEWRFDWSAEIPVDRQAIVVLGGYVIPFGSATDERLADDTLYRCLTAAKLYQRGNACPVLLSGGKVDADAPGPSLAKAMESFLRDHGLAAAEILLEQQSRSTHENAVQAARLLKERNITQVILVTDAHHMFRAEKCFQAQGIDVVPVGCRRRTPGFELSVWSFLPSSGAAQGVSGVVHEWLGVAWYWVKGRI